MSETERSEALKRIQAAMNRIVGEQHTTGYSVGLGLATYDNITVRYLIKGRSGDGLEIVVGSKDNVITLRDTDDPADIMVATFTLRSALLAAYHATYTKRNQPAAALARKAV